MPLQLFLVLALPDHRLAAAELSAHGGSPGQYLRCLNTTGRWATHGTAHAPLLVWSADDQEAARSAATRASAARGRDIQPLSLGKSDWVEGRNFTLFTEALESVLLGYLPYSNAKAQRLQVEADKLQTFAAVVVAAAAATDQDSFMEVRRSASQLLRRRFGGGSVTSACAWLAGKAGQAALDSALAGDIELTGLLSIAEVAEVVRWARMAQTPQEHG